MRLERRAVLQMLAASPLPGLLGVSPAVLERALRVSRSVREQGAGTYAPTFFTATEWETVRLLADLVIPRDDRSGSATDAGAPEFMDHLLGEGSESQQVAIRGGLTWLDRECRTRYGRRFHDAAPAERTEMLNAIAWPDRSAPTVSAGVAFFNRFRDLVASGFWSSEIGVKDLGYVGNTFVTSWVGCPEEARRKIGL
jgi:hypothetical protein